MRQRAKVVRGRRGGRVNRACNAARRADSVGEVFRWRGWRGSLDLDASAISFPEVGTNASASSSNSSARELVKGVSSY